MSNLLDRPAAPVPDVDELERIWAGPAHEAVEARPRRGELPDHTAIFARLACAALAGLALLSRR